MAEDAPILEFPDGAVIDATLTEADWPLLHRLWCLGVGDAGLYALLRLRMAIRRRGNPALDGFVTDPRLGFARWLVRHGRLNDAA